jgi:hypothetical protein
VADTFTIEKLLWLRQVAGDPDLPPQALRLAVVLACDFINRDSREAWPSFPTLEERLGVKENAIRRASDAMEAAGHLLVKQGGGRRNSSRYRWIIRPENTSNYGGVSDDKPLHERKGFAGGNPSVSDQKTPPKRAGNPSVSRRKNPPKMEGEPFDKNPMKEPIDGNPLSHKRESEGAQPSASDPLVSDAPDADRMFVAIFGRWLKRGGEKDARRAFMQALAAGADPEAIARGAAAYLAHRRRDRGGPAAVIQFTTPMARWLDDRGWETWASLPDAEQQAAASEHTEHEAMKARMREREDRRREMLF